MYRGIAQIIVFSISTFIFLTIPGWGQSDEMPRLVYRQVGNLPIVLSAPHGGQLDVAGVATRTGKDQIKAPGKFVTSRDSGTEELAYSLSDAIERRFGKKPYLVLSRAHRKFLDPNRPAELAFDDLDAQPIYADYHNTLVGYCRDVQKQFRHGLLLDLHGQGSAANTVFRGTQNGKTVALLRERHGEAALTGDSSLFGLLKTRGWTVFPDPFDGREQAGFTGGYIVQTYGGNQGLGIDAIQLEFGQAYRSAESRAKTATTLADALADYAARYLDMPTGKAPDEKVAQIRVGVYRGAGTGSSRDALLKVLASQSQFNVVDLTVEEIQRGAWAGCRVLIHPGGSGGGQGKALGEEGRRQVREFVKTGGGYVGVCAGAYLATCDYDWSLNILDAKVIDRQHWNRGFGDVDLEVTPQCKALLGLDRNRISVYYHQGPLLAPANHPDVPDYEGLATFQTEIAKNGAPTGIMTGTTAIAAGKYHQGRVFCFSPHPEKTAGLESMLVRAVTWVAETSKTTEPAK